MALKINVLLGFIGRNRYYSNYNTTITGGIYSQTYIYMYPRTVKRTHGHTGTTRNRIGCGESIHAYNGDRCIVILYLTLFLFQYIFSPTM